MWVPWNLGEGPEFPKTLERAREGVQDKARFQKNIDAMTFALRRDPKTLSMPAFGEEKKRVIRTRDDYAGYRLAIYFEILGEYALEMKWVIRTPIIP